MNWLRVALEVVCMEPHQISSVHVQNEEVVSEITEADKVVALGGLNDNRYCYALANGTIGVYAGAERIWRVKSKHSVAAVCTHDMDSDGTPEVISGWSNGRVSRFHLDRSLRLTAKTSQGVTCCLQPLRQHS